MMRTWQARLRLDEDASGRLAAYADLYGKVERSLFAALAGGRAKNELKREYIQRFGITARHFNAIRIGLEGKVRSLQERQPDLKLDTHGNIVDTLRIPLCTYGKSKAQALAIIGDAVRTVVDTAKRTSKPIALEKLDFAKKKAGLEGAEARYARMLSSFSYSRIVQTIQARAFDAGIEVMAVNPACTSIIGRHKFAVRYGISNHQAAAACIGRRANHLSESPNRRFGDQVTFALPVRNRAKHVWSFWREVSRKEAAHEARLRLAERQSLPAGTMPGKGSIRNLPAGFRHASRPQHCSVDALLMDVPF